MKFQAFHVNPGEKLKKKDVYNDLSNFMSVFPNLQYPIPEDGQGGNIPNWCNPNHAMGAWMNFRRLRVICKVGYGADLGPYGGIFDR